MPQSRSTALPRHQNKAILGTNKDNTVATCETTDALRELQKSRIEMAYITKACLYNFDPLKPHLYIVKLGFTGVYIIFLISAQKLRLWYSLEPPRWGGSNEYSQSMFWTEIWKIRSITHKKCFRGGIKKCWQHSYLHRLRQSYYSCLNFF